ncbi:hypothetical protein AKO1_008696, partial [Acrasis kona]
MYNTDVLDLIRPPVVQYSTEDIYSTITGNQNSTDIQHLTDIINHYSPNSIKLLRLYSIEDFGSLIKQFQSLECLDVITYRCSVRDSLSVVKDVPRSLKKIRIISASSPLDNSMLYDFMLQYRSSLQFSFEIFFWDGKNYPSPCDTDSTPRPTIHHTSKDQGFYIRRFNKLSLVEGIRFDFLFDIFMDPTIAEFVSDRIKIEDLRGYTPDERMIEIPSLQELVIKGSKYRDDDHVILKKIISILADRDAKWINAHAEKGDMIEMLKIIMENGDTLRFLVDNYGLSTRASNVNPLYVAVELGDPSVVKYLIKQDPELMRLGRMTNQTKKESLFRACDGTSKVYEILLLKGEDLSVDDQDCLTSWCKSNGSQELILHGHLLSLECWFDHNYNINRKPPICAMVKRNLHHRALSSFLCRFPKGSFKNCKTPSGKTLLHLLTPENVREADALISHHYVSFLETDDYGFSFVDLMLRSRGPDIEVFEMFDMLISKGLRVHGKTDSVLLMSMFINKRLCYHLIRKYLTSDEADEVDEESDEVDYEDVLFRVFENLKVTTTQLFDNYKKVFDYNTKNLAEYHIAVFVAFGNASEVADLYCTPYFDPDGNKKSLFMSAVNQRAFKLLNWVLDNSSSAASKHNILYGLRLDNNTESNILYYLAKDLTDDLFGVDTKKFLDKILALSERPLTEMRNSEGKTPFQCVPRKSGSKMSKYLDDIQQEVLKSTVAKKRVLEIPEPTQLEIKRKKK